MMSCSICNEDYYRKISNGKANQIPIREKWDNCPNCNSPARFRTLRLLFDRLFAPKPGRPKEDMTALAVAASIKEQEIILQTYGRLVSASLYGDYNSFGAKTIQTDIRKLKEFDDDQFDLVEACGVVDFIYELDQVLSSVYRVLKPGGVFLFHILPHRLTDTFNPPKIIGYKTEPYFPEGVKLPSVEFGKLYILKTMYIIGFFPYKNEIKDYFSDLNCTWFVGKKLPLANSQGS